MKKKIFGFCLVLLFLGTGFGLAQSRILNTSDLICLGATDGSGRSYTYNIKSTNLNEYDNGRFQLCIYYRDSTPTDYIYFENPSRTSNGLVKYDVSFKNPQGGYTYGFYAYVSNGGNSNYLFITLYKEGVKAAELSFQL